MDTATSQSDDDVFGFAQPGLIRLLHCGCVGVAMAIVLLMAGNGFTYSACMELTLGVMMMQHVSMAAHASAHVDGASGQN